MARFGPFSPNKKSWEDDMADAPNDELKHAVDPETGEITQP